jgi:hypothetical protein
VGYGALFSHLVGRWRDLFNADFDVLRHDLTSTYFEVNASDLAEGSKRRHGHSRGKRPDCPQVVIALVVTPDDLPLAYEVLPGGGPSKVFSPIRSRFILSKRACWIKASYALTTRPTLGRRTRALLRKPRATTILRRLNEPRSR